MFYRAVISSRSASGVGFIFGSRALPGSFQIQIKHDLDGGRITSVDATLPPLTVHFCMDARHFKKVGVLATCLPHLYGAARDRFIRDFGSGGGINGLVPEADVDASRQVIVRARICGSIRTSDLRDCIANHSTGLNPAQRVAGAVIRMYRTIDGGRTGQICILDGCEPSAVNFPGARGVLVLVVVPSAGNPPIERVSYD